MDETWYLSCSNCHGKVPARLVFPTSDRSIYVVGRCATCANNGDKASVVFKFHRVTHEEWEALMLIDELPVAK